MTLTAKQKRFVNEYLIDLNATQAAIRAGYSLQRASEIGYQQLQKTTVQNEIDKRMKDREKRTEITQDKVLKEIAIIAFSKVSDYVKVIEKHAAITAETGDQIKLYDADGNPVMVKDVELTLTDQLSEEQQRALSGIKRGRNGIEVSTCDKVKALELVGRHLGMFTDNVNHSGDLGLNIVVDYGDVNESG